MTRVPHQRDGAHDEVPESRKSGYQANLRRLGTGIFALIIFGLLVAFLPGITGVLVGIVFVALLAWFSGRWFRRH